MKEDSDRINMKTINFLWSQKAEEIKKNQKHYTIGDILFRKEKTSSP